ncbi:hypothetical protein SCFA_900002 [anaerobic digester metagenome]|uniref:Uncharacterized protein n=1 Tax=anaerobic digester metagenome TaxID=1263854 RepID=A0A485M6C9_9ZZZZ
MECVFETGGATFTQVLLSEEIGLRAREDIGCGADRAMHPRRLSGGAPPAFPYRITDTCADCEDARLRIVRNRS